MQRNNTYDIAKCWAIVSVIVYHLSSTYKCNFLGADNKQ